MRHPSLWLTVFLLGAMPLTAAAFDYGSNGPLLAAESGGPQSHGLSLPDASAHTRSRADGTRAATPDTTADAQVADPPMAQRVAPSGTNPNSPSLRPGNAPRPAAGNTSTAERRPAPWQSLLPGSIQ